VLRTKSDAAFEQLRMLAGEWETIQDGTPVRETYTVTANGSALLVETKPANETAMITMVRTTLADIVVLKHGPEPPNVEPRMSVCAWRGDYSDRMS
jgi:hypothetical protein